MLDLRWIDDLSRKLAEALPPELNRLKEETDLQFRRILRRTFERMNLVTREEFDAQSSVLERTQNKLAELQKQIEELEQGEIAAGERDPQ